MNGADEFTADACPLCKGIDRARLEPAHAACLRRVFCSACHRKIEVVRVSGGGRPLAAAIPAAPLLAARQRLVTSAGPRHPGAPHDRLRSA